MHTYTTRRPADRTILLGAAVAAAVLAGAAVGISQIDTGDGSDRQPVPASDNPATVRLPTLGDGPVPGMPASTHAELDVDARRKAVLDAFDEVRNGVQP